jgi:hypothetical protein
LFALNRFGINLFFKKFVEILIIQNAENACYNSVSLVNIIVYAKNFEIKKFSSKA